MKGPRWRLPPFLLPFLSFSLALLVVSAAFSGDEEDLQKYQRQLNSEVMAQPVRGGGRRQTMGPGLT